MNGRAHWDTWLRGKRGDLTLEHEEFTGKFVMQLRVREHDIHVGITFTEKSMMDYDGTEGQFIEEQQRELMHEARALLVEQAPSRLDLTKTRERKLGRRSRA